MAAAAPLRQLLRVRFGHPPPLPIPLLSHLPPKIQQATTPAPPLPPSAPTQTPAPNLRDLLFSFHPALQIHPSLPALKAHPSLDPRGDADAREDGDGEAEGPEVWADSVKKKRKRKMNKHKLRKLRRRLRRQT